MSKKKKKRKYLYILLKKDILQKKKNSIQIPRQKLGFKNKDSFWFIIL